MIWRPIETAPSSPDGALKVLTFDPTRKPDEIRIQIADGDWWRKNAKSRGPWTAPTHWAPLPEPPALSLVDKLDLLAERLNEQ